MAAGPQTTYAVVISRNKTALKKGRGVVRVPMISQSARRELLRDSRKPMSEDDPLVGALIAARTLTHA